VLVLVLVLLPLQQFVMFVKRIPQLRNAPAVATNSIAAIVGTIVTDVGNLNRT
jgi:hypothetical protein